MTPLRLSISVSSEIKNKLEQLAKANFRTLNGEINKALDSYVKGNGMVGVDIEQDTHVLDESVIHINYTTPPITQAITNTSFQYSDDLVEEF